MKSQGLLFIRLILLLAFIAFIAGFAVSQYEYVRSLVIIICSACIGIG